MSETYRNPAETSAAQLVPLPAWLRDQTRSQFEISSQIHTKGLLFAEGKEATAVSIATLLAQAWQEDPRARGLMGAVTQQITMSGGKEVRPLTMILGHQEMGSQDLDAIVQTGLARTNQMLEALESPLRLPE